MKVKNFLLIIKKNKMMFTYFNFKKQIVKKLKLIKFSCMKIKYLEGIE